MRKVYLAAPYSARDKMRQIRRILQNYGWVVTSSWLDDTHPLRPGVINTAPEQSDEYAAARVAQDLADIDEADVLMLFTSAWVTTYFSVPFESTLSGGRHVETGYALAKGKRVVLVGQPENIFHRGLPASDNFAEAERLLRYVPESEVAPVPGA